MSFELKDYESKMEKSVSFFDHELATIRAGRANASILDKVSVDYYGTPTPINHIGEVKATDPRTIVVSPWDKSLLKQVEKAILASDLGLQPQNDGSVLRINIPQLSEERRKELSKKVSKMGEEAKVTVRNIRRDAVDAIKADRKSSEITEDDEKDYMKDIQNITDKYTKKIDEIVKLKDKEIMSI